MWPSRRRKSADDPFMAGPGYARARAVAQRHGHPYQALMRKNHVFDAVAEMVQAVAGAQLKRQKARPHQRASRGRKLRQKCVLFLPL